MHNQQAVLVHLTTQSWSLVGEQSSDISQLQLGYSIGGVRHVYHNIVAVYVYTHGLS